MGRTNWNNQATNRQYKDAVFRMLFKEKEELLALFNAVNDTYYKDPEELEVTTLENAVYMSMKNDISCVLDMQLALYEHQSTVNVNMPLRDLFYVARQFEMRTVKDNLYSNRRIELPAPKFVVFYNGRESQPERRIFRLSDSYAKRDDKINLELVVLQININPGYNEALVRKCPTLFEYIQYTDRVRQYAQHSPLPDAVEQAVTECINEGILVDFLSKNRIEVIPMSIFEYDEKKHMQLVRREGYEDGREDGERSGIAKGRKETLSKMNFLIQRLAAENRYDDLVRSTADTEFQNQLLQEYGIL